jgi:hypothetical protein
MNISLQYNILFVNSCLTCELLKLEYVKTLEIELSKNSMNIY